MTGGFSGDGVAGSVFMVIGKNGSALPPQQVWSVEGAKTLLRRLRSSSGVPLHPPGKRTISVAMLREGFRSVPEASHPQDSRRMFRCFGHTSLKALFAPKCAERKIQI